MKVAVYAIALNEEQFVQRWHNSAKDADYILIADTGSTDATIEKALGLGINVFSVSVKPWRFDVARNASLALLPDDIDYCIALDMDEVLIAGWREELEIAHSQNWTRPRYSYTWNWNDDGTPGLTYGGDKIHKRNGYMWKHPVHEVLRTDRIIEIQGWTGLQIHHHADDSKSRSQYMPLLQLSVEEDPSDDRNAFYYARELFNYNVLGKAAEEFKRHLSLPRALWPPERAASMRYLAKCLPEEAEHWLKMAVEEAPGRREAIVDLAQHYYENKQWEDSLKYAEMALEIKDKPLEFLCEAYAWGAAPFDFASIAAYNLKMYDKGIIYANEAIKIEPDNERLKNNLALSVKATEDDDQKAKPKKLT